MHPQQVRVLQQVQEVFRDTLDDAIITAAVEQSGYDAELAVDALCSLCSHSATGAKSEPAPSRQLPQPPQEQAGSPGDCWWDELPGEVQLQV